MTKPLTDTLILAMTRRCSLRTWADAGILQREWALYAAISDLYRRIIVVTYGDARAELELSALLSPSPEVIAIDPTADPSVQRREAARSVASRIESARTVVVKTNQLQGGDAAIAIVDTLRAKGMRAALLARGGYPWSRCEAWEHGADSLQAQAASVEEQRLLRAADLAIVTTHAMASDLAWRHALPESKFFVVPNYVLPAMEAQSGATAREPGAVLVAGRLAPQKRVHLLIQAAASLAERCARTGAPLRLDIVGDGPLKNELHSLASALSAPVVFHPRENHHALRQRMRRCAVFAQLSAYEGHPKTVLEAMAEGAAVLVSDHAPGLTGLIRHGETGIVADADTDTLAATLWDLLQTPSLRARLGSAAARNAQQRFSLERIAAIEQRAHSEAVGKRRHLRVDLSATHATNAIS